MIPITLKRTADDAPGICQKQRWRFRHLFQVNEAMAKPDDLPLISKVRAIDSADSWDKALADKKVNNLFWRGVFSFGVPA